MAPTGIPDRTVFWRDHVTTWQASDLTQKARCEAHRLRPHPRMPRIYLYRDPLTGDLADGRPRISNALAGNAIRPLAVGRKNWLFADAPRGARGGASGKDAGGAGRLRGAAVKAWIHRRLPSLWVNHRRPGPGDGDRHHGLPGTGHPGC